MDLEELVAFIKANNLPYILIAEGTHIMVQTSLDPSHIGCVEALAAGASSCFNSESRPDKKDLN